MLLRALAVVVLLVGVPVFAQTRPTTRHTPEVILGDDALDVTFSPAQLIIPGGLQPSMLCTRSGTLIVQAQVPRKAPPSTRMSYFSDMDTMVSRDGGGSWLLFAALGLNLEGGAIQLRDGHILALDTYIVPTARPDEGVARLFTSGNDWRTLNSAGDAVFDLPGTDFYGSTDDGGRPHAAQRLHRRMIELPNGDLLASFYGWIKGDKTPCPYQPKMKKTRAMLARSSDRGRNWKLISTIAVDPDAGTEGFDEPVLCRISNGPRAGRLLCLMRTGRHLHESFSDDEGATWSAPRPRIFAGIDVLATDQWKEYLRGKADFKGRPLDDSNPDELRGAVVDPDLIELRGGLLVAAFGVRIPQRLCWRYPEHPLNGNYLAISRDHGESWPWVIRLTSGVLTTHYMAVEETPADNQLYIAYDLGGWSKGMHRDVYGRTMTIRAR